MKHVALLAVLGFLALRSFAMQGGRWQQLGRTRSSFGDISPFDPRADGGFVYRNMFDDVPTEIFFPAGSATERYYLSVLPPDKGPSPERWLAYQTKAKGRIRCHWAVRLYTAPDVKRQGIAALTHPGTLARLLVHRGFFVSSSIPKDAALRLRKVQSLADYQADDVRYAWASAFIEADGRQGPTLLLYNKEAWDDASVKDFPYPITDQEKRASGAARVRRHFESRAGNNTRAASSVGRFARIEWSAGTPTTLVWDGQDYLEERS